MSALRYALRSLVNSPAYTVIALVTLALGIGVNTSMFSVVDALLFRAAPYPQPERLAMLTIVTRNGENRSFSEQEIREIAPQAKGFASLTTVGFLGQALSEPGRPAERLNGMAFSADMMETFHVQPMLGRGFTPEEFQPGKNQVILLSSSFWQSRYGGDRSVIGRSLRLDGEAVTIIGVMPPAFEYRMLWGNPKYWRPLNFTRDQTAIRAYRSFSLVGRLNPDATREQIAAQLAPLAASQEKAFPQDYPGLRYKLITLNDAAMDDIGRSISWMLLGLSGFVLLIACANLANLQLARATSSIRDFAIRAALGASRGQLIRQQLTECIVLSVFGGVLGFVVALWVNTLLERSILIDGAPGFRIDINGVILLLTLGISVLTGLIFGVVPALFASRADVSTALKSQARGSTSGRGQHRLRHALIVGEVALALVLLGGAAIMNRGFARLLEKRVGWDTAHIITGAVPMPESRFDTPAKRIEFYRKLEARLVSLPGVERAALTTSLPLFDYGSNRLVFSEAASAGQADNPIASHVMITADYFATLGIPIKEGQTFSASITADSPQQILVNESLARQFWPRESAIGKRLGLVDNATGSNVTVWREIIGVVGDVEPAANIANPSTRFCVYRPLVQEPWSFVNVVVRSPNPGALADTLRRAVSDVDPDLPADQVSTIRQFIDRTQHNLLVVGNLLVGFAGLGLVLAAVGLYGVISNLVAQRTPEFGIRLALGAQSRDVLNDVLKRGLRLALLGLALGLVGAYGLGRFLASVMPRLASSDPVGIASVALLLFVVTLIACWFPARRATKVDPMIALRSD